MPYQVRPARTGVGDVMARQRPLEKVGNAADHISSLASKFTKYGVNIVVVSTNPLSINVKIGDKVLTAGDKKSLIELFVGMLGMLTETKGEAGE